MAFRAKTKRAARGKTLGPRVHESPFADADARVFVAVAQVGSFAGAATLLKMTPSAVSKAVARLESALGLKLLVRTTRSLHLTDEGLSFRDRCERAFALLSEAAEEVSRGARAVRGTIRIGLPPLFGTHFLPRVLSRLLAEHPGLRVEVVSTMRAADIVERRLDLAIVVGPLPDSSFVARPMGYGQFGTFASPAYVARHDAPTNPEDLMSHACLGYSQPDGRDAPFVFRTGELRPPCIARSDDMQHLAAMAVEGLGVAQLPVFAVARELEASRLVRILQAYEPEPKLASLVFPGGRALSERVRVLVEELVSPSSQLPGATATLSALSAGRTERIRPSRSRPAHGTQSR